MFSFFYLVDIHLAFVSELNVWEGRGWSAQFSSIFNFNFIRFYL